MRLNLHKTARIAAMGIGVTVICLCLVGAALIERDVQAPDWLIKRIEARGDLLMQGGHIALGQVTLRLGRDLHPTVTVTDSRVMMADGQEVTQVQQIRALISPRGLLLRGRVLLQDLELEGIRAELTRQSDGALLLAFAANEAAQKEADDFSGLLGQFDAVLARPAWQGLRSVQISGLILQYNDQRVGRSWTVDGAQAQARISPDNTVIKGAFSLLSGRAEPTDLAFEFTRDRRTGTANIAAKVQSAPAQDMATQSPAFAWLRAIDAPLDARIRTEINTDGALGPLHVVATLHRGALRPNASTPPISFDQVKVYSRYLPDQKQLQFDQIDLRAKGVSFTAQGQAFLRDMQMQGPNQLVAQFSLAQIAIGAGGLYPKGKVLDSAQADFRVQFRPFKIDVGQAQVQAGRALLRGHGAVTAHPAGWQTALDWRIAQLGAADLLDFWPPTLKPKSRSWIASNLRAAQFQEVVGGLRTSPDAPATIASHWRFSEARINVMRDMPLITQARGRGVLQDNMLMIALDHGQMATRRAGAVAMGGSRLIMPDTRQAGGLAEFDLELRGAAPAILALLDRKPLELLKKANQPIDVISGDAVVKGRLRTPLRRGVLPDEMTYDFDAALTKVSSDQLVAGKELRADAIALRVDNDGLRARGAVTLDGIGIEGAWHQPFSTRPNPASTVAASIDITSDSLRALGLRLPDGTITGRGVAQLQIDLQRGQPPKFHLSSDLRGIGIALAAIDWHKPRRQSGSFAVSGRLTNPTEISDLRFDAAGLSARGALKLRAGGGLDQADLTRVRLGGWLDSAMTLRGRGMGQPLGVSLRGGSVDLRGAALLHAGGDGGPLSLNLDRLQISDGIALRGFEGVFTNESGLNGRFSGQLNQGPKISGMIVPDGARAKIQIETTDAGGFAQAAGILRDAQGGSLALTLLTTARAGTFDGRLQIKNMRLRNAPAIAALLDTISVVGLLRQLDGQGLAFDEVEAEFRLTPQSVIVTRSSAIGPGLGVSLDGSYGLAGKTLDFQGVISPFYLLNGLGAFLTRKGEGLIGFNFSIAGSADNPQVNVNPLSALTPGMFREIFRRPAPEINP